MKSMPSKKLRPEFKLLIPTNSRKVNALLGNSDLVKWYEIAAWILENDIETLTEDGAFQREHWDDASEQLLWIFWKMDRLIDEDHNLLSEAIEEARQRAAKENLTPEQKQHAPITDAVRAKVKQMHLSGKSGEEISKALDISLPSIQMLKKTLGLVKRL